MQCRRPPTSTRWRLASQGACASRHHRHHVQAAWPCRAGSSTPSDSHPAARLDAEDRIRQPGRALYHAHPMYRRVPCEEGGTIAGLADGRGIDCIAGDGTTRAQPASHCTLSPTHPFVGPQSIPMSGFPAPCDPLNADGCLDGRNHSSRSRPRSRARAATLRTAVSSASSAPQRWVGGFTSDDVSARCVARPPPHPPGLHHPHVLSSAFHIPGFPCPPIRPRTPLCLCVHALDSPNPQIASRLLPFVVGASGSSKASCEPPSRIVHPL